MKETIKYWATEMVKRYRWLIVKFEFSDVYRTYMVSLGVPADKANDDDFNQEVIGFENKLVDIYGDYAPAFTDNEELFSLSHKAEEITYIPTYSDFERVSVNVIANITTWADSKKNSKKSHSEDFSDWAIAA